MLKLLRPKSVIACDAAEVSGTCNARLTSSVVGGLISPEAEVLINEILASICWQFAARLGHAHNQTDRPDLALRIRRHAEDGRSSQLP
jgi:hypothetical protein